MDGQEKRLVLKERRLNDKIQASGLNVVIPPAHHGPIAANTGYVERQDKAFLQQSGEYRIQLLLECRAPVGHGQGIVRLWPRLVTVGRSNQWC